MKNKKRALVLSLLLIVIITISACTTDNLDDIAKKEDKKQEESKQQEKSTYINEINKTYSTLIVDDYNNLEIDNLNNYKIDVEFNPLEKKYSAKQNVTYVNNENIQLNEVYFHIYPNTFSKKETAPFLFDSFESAFPKGFEPGYIEISNISVNNKVVEDYEISGNGDTILRIPLAQSLKPNEKVEISMEYIVKLPPAQDRFGYGDKTFNFGNWYPIAAVYDEEGWNLDPYYSIGDPFYSDTSNYEVTIEAPKDIIIASSGNIISEKVQGDNKVWTIEAKLMRDFAWVASKDFKILQKDVDGTLVKIYVLTDDTSINKYAAEAAFSSIEIFNKVFGKYPYGQYSVVATSFPSGMEYPGIVFIGEKYYNDDFKGYLEIVIVHETGHQWWYSVVGNDEIDEAWLDESLTSYSEVVYADEKYGEANGESYYKNSIENRYERVKNSLPDEVVLKSLSEFESWNDYGPLAYTRGSMLLHAIEEKYGEDTLYSILQRYFAKYRFLNATTDDFIGVCEEVTGDSFKSLVDEYLYGKY